MEAVCPIPAKLRDEYLTEFQRYYSAQLGLPKWRRAAMRRLNLDVARSHLMRLGQLLSRRKVPILDIGSGPGDLCIAFGLEGHDAVGLEPSDRWGELSLGWARSLGLETAFVQGSGESLPFPSGSFGLVCLNYVLEHVRSPRRVLGEARRVLKKNGFCYLNTPNYLFPFEPHYALPWVPGLPRRIGAMYLRLAGRDPEFLSHLNFVTSRSLYRLILENGFSVQRNYVLEFLENPDAIRDRLWKRFAEMIRPLSRWPTLVTLLSPEFSVLLR